MPEDNSQQKIGKLAADILEMARGKLLVNLRFLDLALSSFVMQQNDEITPITATDGKVFVYNPRHILSAFRTEENIPARSFLHSVFHCVFKHMFVGTLVDLRLWDLSCDIAVESVINDLGIQFLETGSSPQQKSFLDGFKDKVSGVTAEKIYRFMLDKNLPEKTISNLETIFRSDDHRLWYMTDEQKGSLGVTGYKSSDSGGADIAQVYIRIELERAWGDISERMKTAIEMFMNGKLPGDEAGYLTQNLKEVTRERYDYTAFLKKFAVRGEIMKINPDEFDYNFYTYGLQLYENIPLIEPLEYKDVKRIRDFVIAIDTSGSTSGDLVQRFVQKTYNVLKSTDSFFSKINLHIIQCDAAIQEDIKITTQEEFDNYLATMKLHGLGGTDFRPVFSYVNSLVECGEFNNLKGLIYFTDGYGDFPATKPDYDTAFVFIDEDDNNYNVPAWAIKLILRKDEI